MEKAEIIAALNDYIDAKELYDETVKEIARLQRRKGTVLQDSVKGSMQEFPYAAKNFHIAGIVYSPEDDSKLRQDEDILAERARTTGETRRKVELYINRIPARMQRIIKYKMFDGETWEDVAAKLGRNASGDSVRMEFKNFMDKEN
ncbi:RNA polymerase subunit sigma-70 [Lacrimispora sp.]|uniref:RNA polymerase subunit sigma-70 n=1 Tax=Lacrimispora sp. TaxID=2719234 RepID=UPI002856E3BF|nr:RNA polymerase subunit sigma-70 [Lacrimispora sp.]MDR7814621.1 RNA polymerase subunit sigma-70 [Lacrimispora sp.]